MTRDRPIDLRGQSLQVLAHLLPLILREEYLQQPIYYYNLMHVPSSRNHHLFNHDRFNHYLMAADG